MKILVLVKQVPDPNAIRFDASGSYSANTPRVVNEYDEYGLEESLLLRESGTEVEITVASVGPATARDAVTRGLAMGADKGILVKSGGSELSSLQTSQALAKVAREDEYDLIWVGQESSDSGTGNVGPQLSVELGIPFVSNVVRFEYPGDGSVLLTREIEDGHSQVRVQLPVIACALSGLSEPRYPSLKGIMAARRKPLDEQELEGVEADQTVTWSPLREEERTAAGTIIEDVEPAEAAEQLVAMLRERELI